MPNTRAKGKARTQQPSSLATVLAHGLALAANLAIGRLAKSKEVPRRAASVVQGGLRSPGLNCFFERVLELENGVSEL